MSICRMVEKQRKKKVNNRKSILRFDVDNGFATPRLLCDKVVRAVADCGYFRSAGRPNKPSEKKASRWSNRLEKCSLFFFDTSWSVFFSWRYIRRSKPPSVRFEWMWPFDPLPWYEPLLFFSPTRFALQTIVVFSFFFLQLYVVQK